MALVTEMTLREQFANTDVAAVTCYEVPAGTVVTPAARAWLVDQRIDLVIGSKVIFSAPRGSAAGAGQPLDSSGGAPAVGPAGSGSTGSGPTGSSPIGSGPIGSGPIGSGPIGSGPVSALPAFTTPEHFDVIDGSQIETKPEHLTALRGNLLVPKNHPQIKFRGQLDALEADLLVMQIDFDRLGLAKGVADLSEVLRYVKLILRSEVLEVPFDQISLFGFDDAELRHRSHYPKEYYGVPHFAASLEDGPAVVWLNQLRTKVREVELSAYDAFAVGGTAEPGRVDLIRALNRLSSAVYIMMFKAKTKEYE